MDIINPFFSIIILCWNNDQTINQCLQALATQTDRDFEVLLIDNGSSPAMPDDLDSVFPQLRILFYRLGQNVGYAVGNNFAAARANGEYLALLNADAFPDPNWLENIRQAVKNHPNSFFASKLIKASQPDRMDGAGDVYHVSGLAWRNGYNTRVSMSHDKEIEVFSACGAAAVFPKKAYHEAGGFDEAFFSYMEDIDLGFRLRLLGYKCIYVPRAVVHHLGYGSTGRRSDLAVYFGQRNLVWTFIKDVPGILVWVLAPFHLVANLFMIVLGFARRQGSVTLKAKRDALIMLPTILKKRAQVQRSRNISIQQLMPSLDWNPISPLVKLLRN